MKYIVIGSGIAGINAAMTLLERGKQVEIWDADHVDPSYINKPTSDVLRKRNIWHKR